MTNLRLDEITNLIAQALTERVVAKAVTSEEDRPYANHELPELVTGVANHADNILARSMAPASSAGHVMEAARLEGGRAQRRQRQAANADRRRRTQARRDLFDETLAKPVTPDPKRMEQAWTVVGHLLPIVQRIATEKRQWAARFLGDVADDLVQEVLEKLVLTLAKSDHDLIVYAEAAGQLGTETRSNGQIPGDQADEEFHKHRKALRRARKELMSMTNHWTMTTLVDLYREARNLRWENLDILATIQTSIAGVGGDPYVARTKADRAPAMLGTTFTGPGQLDRDQVAAAVTAAITDRGLDRLTELLLDESSRRTDGTVKWRELAELIFMATTEGRELWPEVQRGTTHGKDPKRLQAEAATRLVQRQFEWLPDLIVAVVEAMDARPICYADGHAIMASDLDMYQPDPHPLGERRYPLQPTLRYASATDAARALVEALGQSITGEDLVRSIQFA